MKKQVFKQFLPIGLEEAWAFFSTPANLNRITPGKLHFRMLDPMNESMYEGMLIRYKIKPMLNLPMDWVSEITTVREMEYFIDEQVIGPYRVWHHEHHFQSTDGGVWMTDILYYDIGWGILGKLAGWLWVDRQVQAIFRFRESKLEAIFPKPPR